MWCRGPCFYIIKSISTWSLKDLNISMNLINLGYSISTPNLKIVWFTWRWKKFTRLCLCESPSKMGARFAFCNLQEPKISSLSICVNLSVQIDPREYFKIASPSCLGFLNWVTLCKTQQYILSFTIGLYNYILVKKDMCDQWVTKPMFFNHLVARDVQL